MAEDKKGFLLYADQKAIFDQLPNDKAGELIKFIFAYVNDENPESDDPYLNLAFTLIKQQLKRDLKKYEEKLEKKSISGREGNLKRWYKSVYDLYKTTELSLEDAEEMAKGRKVSHTDKMQSHTIAKIADNVTDNVNDNVTDIKYNTKSIDFDGLLDYINKKLNRQFRTINKDLKSKYKARLRDGYTKEDIIQAINNASNDTFHKQKNYQYLTPEFFSRATTLDKFSTVTEVKEENLNATIRTVEDVKKLWE